jgi:hypothetical protein
MEKREQKILDNGHIKIGKNQIFQDGNLFVVEKYEYTENEQDYFSVNDAYDDLEKAISVAKRI